MLFYPLLYSISLLSIFLYLSILYISLFLYSILYSIGFQCCQILERHLLRAIRKAMPITDGFIRCRCAGATEAVELEWFINMDLQFKHGSGKI